MKFISLSSALALFTVTTQAIQLDQDPALANLLVQTSADVEANAEDGYATDPYGNPHPDPHDDCNYYCPPALEKCPGVLQPPGPCKTALEARPLCYCNSGFMHTDWDHTVSVDDEACPDNCKNKKNPHPVGYPPHVPHPKPVHPVHPVHPTPTRYPSYTVHAEEGDDTEE